MKIEIFELDDNEKFIPATFIPHDVLSFIDNAFTMVKDKNEHISEINIYLKINKYHPTRFIVDYFLLINTGRNYVGTNVYSPSLTWTIKKVDYSKEEHLNKLCSYL